MLVLFGLTAQAQPEILPSGKSPIQSSVVVSDSVKVAPTTPKKHPKRKRAKTPCKCKLEKVLPIVAGATITVITAISKIK